MIVSTVITVIALLIIIISVLLGLKRGMIKSSIKAGGYIISALLAFLLAKPISNLFSGLNDTIIRLLESKIDEFSDITSASPTLVNIITKLPIALLAPILFVILFFIFNLIVSIVLKITMKPIVKLDVSNAKPLGSNATEEEHEARKIKVRNSKLIGGAVSIVPAFVLIFVLFLPLAGYLNMAGQTMDALVKTTQNSAQVQTNVQLLSNNELNDSGLEYVNVNYIKPANNNIFIKMVYSGGGKSSFNAMTSFKLDGDKVSIPKEIAILSSAAGNMKKLTGKPIKEYTKEQTDAIGNLTDMFSDSVILPKVTAELLSSASTKWSDDEKFINIEKQSVSPTIDPLFNRILTIFKTETEDTIKDDLNTLADIFVILIDNNVLSSVDNQEEFVNVLAKEGLITSLLVTLHENERMVVLTNEITNMGIRALATALKIPEDTTVIQKEVVNHIKDKAISAITSDLPKEEKIAALVVNLNEVFSDNLMDVSEELTPIIAQTLIDTFDKDGKDSITNEEINDYFVMLNAVYEVKTNENTTVNQKQTHLLNILLQRVMLM